ncbi:MAG: STAS domain-containing protein [Thermoanaerobaculia bacterium]
MIQIETRERNGITILDPKGKITIGIGDIALRDSVRSALEDGATDLLINFSKVKRMDSSGLGELVASSERTKAIGGKLKITNLPSSIEQLLTITALMNALEVYEDEDAALASFN